MYPCYKLTRQFIYLAFASLALSLPLGAQSAAPPELLNQLIANADQYRATLPSLTADETILSEASYRGMFKDKVESRGTFRAVRGAPGEPLKESREITISNGKPLEPGKQAKLPFALFGGFGRFQEMFFTPKNIHCFAFNVMPEPGPGGTIQISISVPSELEGQSDCAKSRAGLTGLVRVDAATHQLVHLERTVPDTPATRRSAPFASVDCAPTKVGDETYWLPTVVTGGSANRAIRGQFVAHYSNYHRYAASITLLPGAIEVDNPEPAEPAAPPTSTPR